MPAAKDPTAALRAAAAALPGAVEGNSCNQFSYKAAKKAFLYVGPGAKGVGFKAMFKLDASLAKAEQLAAKEPERFEVGKNGWVTTRFSAEKPLAKKVWGAWLEESHAAATGSAKPMAARRKATTKRAASTARRGPRR